MTAETNSGRTIGIRHRVKVTAAGEARPTQIAIREADGAITLHNCKYEGDEFMFITEELLPGDVIAMSLGGSGDLLAFATNRIAQSVGATVVRIPPFQLKAARRHDDTSEDATVLSTLAAEQSELFFPMLDRDASLVRVREHFRHFIDSMKARIACEQRLRQRVIGQLYTTNDGIFPEGGIEKAFDGLKANDKVLAALVEEEKLRERELKKALKEFDVFTTVFDPIEGVGPRIAARLIDAIGDIRRFDSPDKLVNFCGVGFMQDKDGNTVMQRRRSGIVANWHGDARQALYLLMDQWNRRPNSMWGQAFRANKEHFRKQHPEVVLTEGGKKRYTDGHIHKMAGWRTATQFVRWLFGQWWTVVDPEWAKRQKQSHDKWLRTGERIFGTGAWKQAPGSVKSRAMVLALGDEPETALTQAQAEYDERWSAVLGDWYDNASFTERKKAVARYNVHQNVDQAIAEATQLAA